jgi:hypothetical protein
MFRGARITIPTTGNGRGRASTHGGMTGTVLAHRVPDDTGERLPVGGLLKSALALRDEHEDTKENKNSSFSFSPFS